jgi:hypothetical protein
MNFSKLSGFVAMFRSKFLMYFFHKQAGFESESESGYEIKVKVGSGFERK